MTELAAISFHRIPSLLLQLQLALQSMDLIRPISAMVLSGATPLHSTQWEQPSLDWQLMLWPASRLLVWLSRRPLKRMPDSCGGGAWLSLTCHLAPWSPLRKRHYGRNIGQ